MKKGGTYDQRLPAAALWWRTGRLLTRLDRHKRGGPIPDPFTRGSGWAKAPEQNADGRSFMALVNVPEHLLLDDVCRDLLRQSFVERGTNLAPGRNRTAGTPTPAGWAAIPFWAFASPRCAPPSS